MPPLFTCLFKLNIYIAGHYNIISDNKNLICYLLNGAQVKDLFVKSRDWFFFNSMAETVDCIFRRFDGIMV